MAEQRQRRRNSSGIRPGQASELQEQHCDFRQHSVLDGYEYPFSLYAAQNNLGVIRLREKRYLDAANCFCQAVKCVNEHRMPDHNCPYANDMLRNDTNTGGASFQNYHGTSQQSLSNTESSEGHFTGSSGTSSATELRSSPTDRIDSFYLLLDQYGNSNDDFKECDCEACHGKCSAERLPQDTNPDQTQKQQQQQDTYMFRNPIIVSKRGVRPTTLLRRTTNTSACFIDKETSSKLSLISVYNMALTYHLAAIDKDNQNKHGRYQDDDDDEEEEAKESNHYHTSKEHNHVQHSTPVNSNSEDPHHLRKTRVELEESCEYSRPAKRQRRDSLCNKCTSTLYCPRHASVPESTTTTSTSSSSHSTRNPDSPIRNNSTTTSTSNNNKNNNSEDSTVDTVLLGQALSYYQIAYRILVSEQRVLVSQTMVILNNIGHIHRLMGNERTARKCFRRLLTTMIYLQQSSGHAHELISHWDSFLTNVLDLIVAPGDSHKNYAPAA